METSLNLAWVLCSLGLILRWVLSPWGKRALNGIRRGNRYAAFMPGQRRRPSEPCWQLQLLALAVVVLLLLPVISLSDDLMATQGLAETDSCVRRAQHSGDGHTDSLRGSFALPEQNSGAPVEAGLPQESLLPFEPATHDNPFAHWLDSRPPPQA